MSHVSTLQLSLTDIARLAGVQRPVVSMWRRRALDGHPFPRPVAVVSGGERFDAVEVVAYLRDTARGKNPDARNDLAAHARLASVTALDESVAFDGLTALLCLSPATSESLGEFDANTLLALANEFDPDDDLLVRELQALGGELTNLAAYADALADAAYSARAAFENLMGQQLHRSLPGHAAMALQPAATAIVAEVARALAADASMEAPLFIDVTDGSADLLLATARAYAVESPPSVATLALTTRSARLARRRLRVHDLHRLDVLVDGDADFSVPSVLGGAVHVLQLPSAGQPDLSDAEVIDAIGDLVVQLADESRVVVLGPASALTDRPTNADTDRARDAILRSDRLRAVVRLPKGLLVRSPRKPLALFALGPAHPDVPAAERWTAVADVSERALSPGVIEGLVTDVVASMASDRDARGHAFGFARRVRTTTLLPGRKALVDRAAHARGRSPSADLVVRIDELARGLGPVPLAHLRVEPVASPKARMTTYPGTLGGAVAARECRIVPGNRIDPVDLNGSEGRLAIGPDELLGTSPLGRRRIDLLTFAGAYPAARFTEPGDVIFCSSPRVAAWVDHEGGAAVVSPARVVRVVSDPDRVEPPRLPGVLAADIVAAAAHDDSGAAKDWRRWPIRQVPAGQHAALAETLSEVERERRDLRTRLERLEALAAAVTEGVTAQALTITARPTSPAADTHDSTYDTPTSAPGTTVRDEEGS